MKRILVPSDLSPISESALKLAVDIADKTTSEIYLVNFTKHPFGTTFTATGDITKKYDMEADLYTLRLLQKNMEDLHQMAGKFTGPNRSIHIRIYDKDFKDGVTTFCKEQSIDLIVMGTSGETTVGELFSGNHTTQIIETASCPVISINQPYPNPHLSDIALGLDLHQDKHDNFTQAALFFNDLAVSLRARVHAVNIVKKGAKNQEQTATKVKEFTEKHGIITDTISVVESDTPEKAIVEFAGKKAASIVTVFTHSEDNFFKLFSDSFSEEISKHSAIPVMTINLHNV